MPVTVPGALELSLAVSSTGVEAAGEATSADEFTVAKFRGEVYAGVAAAAPARRNGWEAGVRERRGFRPNASVKNRNNDVSGIKTCCRRRRRSVRETKKVRRASGMKIKKRIRMEMKNRRVREKKLEMRSRDESREGWEKRRVRVDKMSGR